MGKIVKATAYANNEIAVIAWQLDGMIDNCLGFEITRIYVDGPDKGTEKVLPAWVPFKGQQNRSWQPQTTSIWPVQKLMWRDLTLRKHRADLGRNPVDVTFRYRVRALLSQGNAQRKVPQPAAGAFDGKPVGLYYLDEGVVTNDAQVSQAYGDQLTSAFTNGILSTQWLAHTLQDLKKPGTAAFKAASKTKAAGKPRTTQVYNGIQALIGDPKSDVRAYLAGDLPDVLLELPQRATTEAGSALHMALYELNDGQLVDAIAKSGKSTSLILSNTGVDKQKSWDTENQPARKTLRKAVESLQDRMFNNAGHIGHNKFIVFSDKGGKPQAVLTGSTNWTPNALCAQSNNALIVHSPELASQYLDYWNALSADTKLFKMPKPLTAAANNNQGPQLRDADAKALPLVTLKDGTTIQLWRSPNMARSTLGADVPPDFAQVYSLMRKAKDAIFFAVFLPSGGGLHSVIEEAVQIGLKDPSLLVCGAISDPMAMWRGPESVATTTGAAATSGKAGKGRNAKTATASAKKPAKSTSAKAKPAPIFDQDNVHLVLAQALTEKDATGDFEAELLKAGFAIIHDKIVVVDPLSDDAAIVMGSHNLGYKASYCNDDNLLIIRNNKRLAQAYCAHVIDLYDHYRFRAVQQDIQDKGGKLWDGFLSTDASWLERALQNSGKSIAAYFAGKSGK